ncbi:MAG: alpha/beta hydrolase [Kiritimatiellae bacterium]|nr:alpha/beta hydrolase [Kiritimatiellia bacterium]
MKQDYALLDGRSVYYEIHGSGSPLLLIAGLGSDSQSWAMVLEGLAARHQVIVFDNRGAGRTQPMDGPLDISGMAEDALALLNHLSLSRAHVLGHSMGGMIALELALRHPGRVNRLVLAATAAKPSARDCALMRSWVNTQRDGLPPERWFNALFYWLFTESFFENSQAVAEALEYALKYPWPQSQKAFANQVEAIAAFDAVERLSGLSPKTMILMGEQDILFTPEKAMRDFIRIHGLRMHLIPNAAHSIHLEAPAPFTEAVLAFLGE